MKFRKNNIIISGRNFFYWEKNNLPAPGAGAGGQAQKETIVLLHGFPGNHTGLVDLADNLGIGSRIMVPDLPACGQSQDLTGMHNLKNYSDWLNVFLESLSIDHAIIIGHSFGSRVALLFSLDYPNRVKKLVLITPVVEVDGFIARIATTYYKIAGILPAYLQKIMISNGFSKKIGNMILFKSPDVTLRRVIVARDIKELKHLNQKVVIELFDEFYGSELMVMAKGVSAPVLIIAGDQDEIATLKSVTMLASHLKNSLLEVMENSGHLVPLERPRAVAEVIKSWLK